MAYSHKQKIKIQFDYESGKYTVRKMADKWKMSPQTLKKFADENNWTLGARDGELNEKIEEKAKVELTKKVADRLVNLAEEHINTLETLDTAYQILLWQHIQALKQSQGFMTKADGETWKMNYQALQSALDFIDKSFRSKRLALGLKETEAPKMGINIFMDKVKDYKHLTDKELDMIIANETRDEEVTIN